jgi:hypothetical protein
MYKNILLIVAMLTWLLAGGGLIYLAPAIADAVTHSPMTGTWLVTLHRGGYYPGLAAIGSTVMVVVGTLLAIVQARQADRPLLTLNMPKKPH